MRKLAGFAILGLSLSVPTFAQHLSGTAGPNSTGGGGLGSGGATGAGNMSGGSAVAFHTLERVPPAQFQMIDVSGEGLGFVPSSFVPFEQSLEEGNAALAIQRKSLGEIAREYRNSEKPKASKMLTQDAFGNARIEAK